MNKQYTRDLVQLVALKYSLRNSKESLAWLFPVDTWVVIIASALDLIYVDCKEFQCTRPPTMWTDGEYTHEERRWSSRSDFREFFYEVLCSDAHFASIDSGANLTKSCGALLYERLVEFP